MKSWIMKLLKDVPKLKGDVEEEIAAPINPIETNYVIPNQPIGQQPPVAQKAAVGGAPIDFTPLHNQISSLGNGLDLIISN